MIQHVVLSPSTQFLSPRVLGERGCLRYGSVLPIAGPVGLVLNLLLLLALFICCGVASMIR